MNNQVTSNSIALQTTSEVLQRMYFKKTLLRIILKRNHLGAESSRKRLLNKNKRKYLPN